MVLLSDFGGTAAWDGVVLLSRGLICPALRRSNPSKLEQASRLCRQATRSCRQAMSGLCPQGSCNVSADDQNVSIRLFFTPGEKTSCKMSRVDSQSVVC